MLQDIETEKFFSSVLSLDDIRAITGMKSNLQGRELYNFATNLRARVEPIKLICNLQDQMSSAAITSFVGIVYFNKGEYGVAKDYFEMAAKQKPNNKKDSNIKDLEISVSNKVGLNVQIMNKKNNKGKIIFEYNGLDQLNKIIEIIKNYY